jgi:transcriptional regulator with XRE-family HTH domain
VEYDFVAALLALLRSTPMLVDEACEYIEIRREAVEEWITGRRRPLGGITALLIEGFVRKHDRSGQSPSLEEPPCSSIANAIRRGAMQKIFSLVEAAEYAGYAKHEELLRAVRGDKFTGAGDRAARLEWFLAKHGLWNPPRLRHMGKAGRVIFEIIGSRQMSTDELAAKLGVTRNRLLCWLSGSSEPVKEMAAKVVALKGSETQVLIPQRVTAPPSPEAFATPVPQPARNILTTTLAEAMMIVKGLGEELLELGTQEDRAAFRKKYNRLPEDTKVVAAALCSERSRQQWLAEKER